MTARPSTDRGAALITALVLMVLLGSMSTLMFDRSRLLAKRSVSDRARLQAFYAAEGGLAHTRHEIAQDPLHRGGTLRVGGCDVSTSVTADTGEAGAWTVVVEAFSPGPAAARCVLEVELRAAVGLPGVVGWVER